MDTIRKEHAEGRHELGEDNDKLRAELSKTQMLLQGAMKASQADGGMLQDAESAQAMLQQEREARLGVERALAAEQKAIDEEREAWQEERKQLQAWLPAAGSDCV